MIFDFEAEYVYLSLLEHFRLLFNSLSIGTIKWTRPASYEIGRLIARRLANCWARASYLAGWFRDRSVIELDHRLIDCNGASVFNIT